MIQVKIIQDYGDLDNLEEKNLVWIFYFDKTNYKFYILNFQNFTYLKNKRQGNPGLQDFTHEQNSTRFSSYIS